LIQYFIKNSILTHILFIFLIIIAYLSFERVPKELFPVSTYDKISIQGAYSGASAKNLDKMVVSQIEDALKTYSEIESVESLIRNGSFAITINLKPNSDKTSLLSDFKSEVSLIKRDLPSDMNEPTVSIVKKVFPLIFVSIAGDQNDEYLLKISEELKDKLSTSLPELSNIEIRGDGDTELSIELNTDKIEALNLSKSQILSAISSLYSIYPIGKVEDSSHYYISSTNGQDDIETIKNSILNINNQTIYLKDISKVHFRLSTPTQLGKFNGIKNMTLDIKKGEKGDAIVLSKQVRQITNEFAKKHSDLTFGFSTDTSKWVKNRLNTVVSNIVFGLVLVFFFMWIFVNKRISFVVTIGIPTSFAFGMIFLDYFGFSLNVLSMLGALIALGMIVDEAIVVAENIHRHFEMGKDKLQASIDGTVEVFWPVVVSALTTIFAFLPLLMIQGEIGIFMKIIPIMVTILLISSLLEAFLFLPLHSKELLREADKDSFSDKMWEKIDKFYKHLINVVLNYKVVFLILFLIVVPFLVAKGFKNSKFQLFPDFDTTQIYVLGTVKNDSTIYETSEKIKDIESVLKGFIGKDVDSFSTVIGFKMDAKNEAKVSEKNFHIFIDLNERIPTDWYNKYLAPLLSPVQSDNVTRTFLAKEISKQIEEKISKYKDSFEELIVFVPTAGVVKSDVLIQLSSTDDKHLISTINKLKSEMHNIKGVYNIADDASLGPKTLKIELNDYAKSLGFTESYIVTNLRGYFGDAEYGKMFLDSVARIKLKDIQKDKIEFFKNYQISIPNSTQKITLSKISNFIIEDNFRELNKYDGVNSKTVFASLDKKIITVKEFYEQINPYIKELKNSGIKVNIGGAQKVGDEVKRDLQYSFIIAVILIFIILVAMFRSLILPVVLISVIPLSMLGVIFGNYVMDLNLTMIGMIGVVGLAGVVVNDGIIMIEFIKKATNVDEIVEKASHRVRPILLTSVTTVLGLFTLMFYPFGQSVMLQPLAVSLGFGLAWATVLNLFYLPLIYVILFKIKNRWIKRRS
jgi:multidrug efflux pump subunit AcrB